MRTLAVLVLASMTTTAADREVRYEFTTLDDPAADVTSGERTNAFGINDRGQIVGSVGPHGFVYSAGVYTTIDVPGATFTACFAINNAGTIVGNYRDSLGAHGFVLRDGSFATIDVPGAGTANGAATRAYGINAAGQIVGDFDVAVGTGAATHGYLLSDGTFTTIDFPGAYFTQAFGINDAGRIVGSTAFPGIGGDSGYMLADGVFRLIVNPAATSPGDPVTVAFGINNRGQIVGYYTDAGAYRAYVYADGTFTEIDLPPGADHESFAVGTNNSGDIVGNFNSATGLHGFIATPSRGR